MMSDEFTEVKQLAKKLECGTELVTSREND